MASCTSMMRRAVDSGSACVTELHQYGERGFGALHGAVESVALDGFAAGSTDQGEEFLAAEALRRGSTGVMVDALFHDGAIEIVGAEAEGDLRDTRGHHHPVGFDVRDVVQHQTGRGDVLDVGETGGLWNVLERRVVGVEGQRDVGDRKSV